MIYLVVIINYSGYKMKFETIELQERLEIIENCLYELCKHGSNDEKLVSEKRKIEKLLKNKKEKNEKRLIENI
jgi:hypothetical protein